jgi:hypothetical protein
MNYLKPIKSKDLSIKNPKKEFHFNIGLAILRPILAFLVIVTHCYNHNLYQGILKLLYINSQKIHFHIRIFIIISFYFSYNTLISNDYKKKLKRFERILIPYFLWPIIIYFFNIFLKKIFNIGRNITFTDLKKQFIGGSGFIYSLYFQWSLALLNIFHMLIILLFRKHCIFILIILSIISFNCQYNGINLLYFIKCKMPLGRTIEFIPCSVIGFIISYLGIMNCFKKYRLKTIIVCIYICYILIYYDIFIEIKGFGVCGIKMFIFSICIFIIFALFPSEKMKNKIIIKFIKQLTNYTAGIYYMHLSVFYYTCSYIKSIKQKTIKGCMINYLICYCISLIGNFFFGRTLLRHLFV